MTGERKGGSGIEEFSTKNIGDRGAEIETLPTEDEIRELIKRGQRRYEQQGVPGQGAPQQIHLTNYRIARAEPTGRWGATLTIGKWVGEIALYGLAAFGILVLLLNGAMILFGG